MTILRRGAPSVGRGAAGLWAVSLMIIGTAATPATAATAVERPAGYPSKAVRLLVGSSPGGGADLTTRLMAQRLSDQWGKPVIVDNRAGGSGAIAMGLTASAAPDGYTFMSTGSLIVTATPLKKVPFDTRKVFTPIVQMTTQPYRLVTHPAVAAATVRRPGRAGPTSNRVTCSPSRRAAVRARMLSSSAATRGPSPTPLNE